MTHSSSENFVPEKFIRKRPGWTYIARRTEFIVITLAALVAYAIFLLPGKETPAALSITSIVIFILLVLSWSANILADGERSEIFKGLVAFGLIAVFCWLFYMYSGTKWDKLINAFFNWKRMEGAWDDLFSGLLVTLELALISAFTSILVGLIVAILRSFNSATLNIFLIAYVDLFRSIPMIALMVLLFFALPYMGASLGSIAATVVALSLGYGAYMSESFRAGFEAVHQGQIEAARALGMSRWQTMRLVILPQAVPIVIPTLTGNLVAMLKDTAVASVVAAPELLKRARELYTGRTTPTPLVAAALIYLLVLIPLVRISNMLESRIKKTR